MLLHTCSCLHTHSTPYLASILVPVQSLSNLTWLIKNGGKWHFQKTPQFFVGSMSRTYFSSCLTQSKGWCNVKSCPLLISEISVCLGHFIMLFLSEHPPTQIPLTPFPLHQGNLEKTSKLKAKDTCYQHSLSALVWWGLATASAKLLGPEGQQEEIPADLSSTVPRVPHVQLRSSCRDSTSFCEDMWALCWVAVSPGKQQGAAAAQALPGWEVGLNVTGLPCHPSEDKGNKQLLLCLGACIS